MSSGARINQSKHIAPIVSNIASNAGSGELRGADGTEPSELMDLVWFLLAPTAALWARTCLFFSTRVPALRIPCGIAFAPVADRGEGCFAWRLPAVCPETRSGDGLLFLPAIFEY